MLTFRGDAEGSVKMPRLGRAGGKGGGGASTVPIVSTISCLSFLKAIPNPLSPFFVVASRDATTPRIILGDTTNQTIDFYNTTADTLIQSVAFNDLGGGVRAGAFATSTKEFYLLNGNAAPANAGFRVFDKDGNVITNIALVKPGQGAFYDPTSDRIITNYFDDTGTLTNHIIEINPNTHAVVGDHNTAIGVGAASLMSGYPGHVVLQDFSNLDVFETAGFTLVGSIILPSGWSNGFDYASTTNKIYVGSFNGITGDSEVWEVNPATFAVDFVYAMVNGGENVGNISFNPATGALLAQQNGFITVINPVARTIVCTKALNNAAIAENGCEFDVDYASGKAYLESDVANETDVYQ